MISVLFVCTGNICRSPTAEGVFRHLVMAAGLEKQFHIDSAGVDSYHVGEAPDKRAVKIARSNGVTLDEQRARGLKPEDFATFDYIYAMDGGHLFDMQQHAPDEAKNKIQLFMAAAGLGEDDVPDPWYGTDADFEKVFNMVDEGARALLHKIKETHGL